MATKVYDISSSIIKIGSNDILYLSYVDPNIYQLTSLPFGSAYNLRLFRKGSQTGTDLNGLWTSNPVSPFNFSQQPISLNGVWLNNTNTLNLPSVKIPTLVGMSYNGQVQFAIQSGSNVDCSYCVSNDYGISWTSYTDLGTYGVPNVFLSSNILTGFGNYLAINQTGNIIYYISASPSNLIRKSINSGVSFSTITPPASSANANIACDSTGQIVLWAGGGPNPPFSSRTPTFAYYSLNGGISWNVVQGTGIGTLYFTNVSLSNNGNIGFLIAQDASANINYVYYTKSGVNATWTYLSPLYSYSGISNITTSLCLSGDGNYVTVAYSNPSLLVGQPITYNIATSTNSSNFTPWNNTLTSTTGSFTNLCLSYTGQYQYVLQRNSNINCQILISSNYGESWNVSYNPNNINFYSISSSSQGYYLNASDISFGLIYNSANGYNPGVDISYNPTIPGGNTLKVYLDPSGNIWYNNPPTSSQLPVYNNTFTEGGYLGLIQRNYQISNYLSPSVAATFFNNLQSPDLQVITSTSPYNYFLNTPTFGSVNPTIPGPYGQNMSYDWFVQYNNITKPQLIVPDISYISQTVITTALPLPLPTSGNIDLFCETTYDLSCSDPFYADPLLITYFVDPSVNTFYGLNTIEISSNIVQLADISFNDSSSNQIFDFQAFFYGDDTNRTIGCRWVDPSYSQLTNDITGSPYNLRLYKRQIGIEPSEIAQWFPTGEVAPFIYQNDISMGFPIQSNWLDISLNTCPSCKVMAFFFDAAGNVSYNSVMTSTMSPFTQANSGGYILVVQRNYKDSTGNSYYTTVGSYLNYISPSLKVDPLGPTTIIVNTSPPYRSTYYNNGELNMSYQWFLNNPSTGFVQNVGTNISYNFNNDLNTYNGIGQSFYQCAVTYQFNYPPYDNNGTPFFEITPVTILYGNGDLTVLSQPYDINLCFKRTSFPPPPWARFSLVCGTNGSEYTAEQLQMRRKAEVLQYYNNKVNMQKSTKAQQWSFIARGLSTPNNSYATQTVNYTNPNTTGFPNNNRAILLSNKCTNQALRSITNPSYCSDVPGPVVPLTFDPRVPLVRFKRIYTYPTVNQPATSNQVNSG